MGTFSAPVPPHSFVPHFPSPSLHKKCWETRDIYLDFTKKKRQTRKRAKGKTPIIVACKNRTKKAAFIAMKAFDFINFSNVEAFVQKHLLVNQEVRTDAYRALNIIY